MIGDDRQKGAATYKNGVPSQIIITLNSFLWFEFVQAEQIFAVNKPLKISPFPISYCPEMQRLCRLYKFYLGLIFPPSKSHSRKSRHHLLLAMRIRQRRDNEFYSTYRQIYDALNIYIYIEIMLFKSKYVEST